MRRRLLLNTLLLLPLVACAASLWRTARTAPADDLTLAASLRAETAEVSRAATAGPPSGSSLRGSSAGRFPLGGNPWLSPHLAPPGLLEQSPATTYGRDNLHLRIDGAADSFIARGFVELTCTELRFADGQSVNVEVYDMGKPEAAKEQYAASQAGAAPAVATPAGTAQAGARGAPATAPATQPPGQAAAQVGEQVSVEQLAVYFQRQRFYVQVTTFNSDGETPARLLAAARAVDDRLRVSGP